MIKKIRFLIVIFLLLTISSLTGCKEQKSYEQIGFVLQTGIELKNNNLEVTFTIPVIGETSTTNAVQLLTTDNVDLIREARNKAREMSPSILEKGKVQQVFFSAGLASKGIHNFLDVFDRDPTDDPLAYVVIVDGSPKELFERMQSFKNKPRLAYYVNQLLDNSVESSYIPKTKIYNFNIDYFSKGTDPMVPLIKAEKDNVKVLGSALFSEDKMVGKVNTKQTALLLAMKGKAKTIEYVAYIPNNSSSIDNKRGAIALSLTSVKKKVKISIKDNTPVVNISLNFGGNVDEYIWNKLDDISEENMITKNAANQIKHDCEEALKYTQQVGSDPLGIGDMVRAQYYSYWKGINWNDTYKSVVFNVDVNLKIKQHGVID